MSVTDKDIPTNLKLLGQYLTPGEVADFCLSKITLGSDYIIEPSCGRGIFLDKIRAKSGNSATIKGIELDGALLMDYCGPEPVSLMNFYDFKETFDGPVHFIGNPPYRSPAYSLTSRSEYVKKLRNKYGVKGVREECVLFILKTYDLLRTRGGRISYILPSAIFKNNSRAFTHFTTFLKQKLNLLSVWEIGGRFEGVDRDLVFVDFEVGSTGSVFSFNGQSKHTDDFYGVSSDIIPFQRIFKKTYLGSVPCEGIFMSVKSEPLSDFRDRLMNLFCCHLTPDNLIARLSYDGKPHLKALQKADPKKIQVMLKYVEQTKSLAGFDLALFRDLGNYKLIRHRDEDRFYFRHEFLKKAPFVYQLNPNPGPSLYFPGNPSSSSGDYFGRCPYDVNRNSGPGANRTVPLVGFDDNITDDFKAYWDRQTGLPYRAIAEYVIYISKSGWYRQFKKQNQRFYFGVPLRFDRSFLDYWDSIK